ncbi:MAG: hypothetical protein ACRENE_31055 [Polyangiaceae bacterium]
MKDSRRTRWTWASAAAVGGLVCLFGCEAVPTLTFEDQAGDAASGTCPMALPTNAKCCGTGNAVPCYGQNCSGMNCATGCDKCAGSQTTPYCCSRSMTNVICVMDPSVCK